MSLKDLTKEQKQYAVLGVLAAAVLIVLLYLGVRFSLSSVNVAKTELNELTSKIQTADRTLARRAKVSGEFMKTVRILRKQLENAPPERNYYSWATEVIYSAGRDVGLEIDTIDEINGASSKSTGDSDGKVSMESYALRITAHGGFNNVKVFIQTVGEKYPLVRFTGIEVNAGASPEEHDIQLFMQWPFNLGQIAKNWDSVELRQRQLDLLEQDENPSVPSRTEPEVAASEKPEPTVEQEQPVVRKEEPAVEPPVEAAVEEAKPVAKPVVAVRKEPTPPAPRMVSNPEPAVEPVQPVQAPADDTVRPEPEPVVAASEPAVVTPELAVEAEEAVAAAVAEPQETAGESPEEVASVVTNAQTLAEPAQAQTAPEPEVAAAEVPADTSGPRRDYTATEKSARILKQLLNANNSHSSDDALGSLLDDLLEDTDEAK